MCWTGYNRTTGAGVAIGAGWQENVTYVNLACYYLIGIPTGILLGYVMGMQVKVVLFYNCGYASQCDEFSLNHRVFGFCQCDNK